MRVGPPFVAAGLAGGYVALWASEWWSLVPAVLACVFGLLVDDGGS